MGKIKEKIRPLQRNRLGEKSINFISYSDDTVLIAKNENDLQCLLHTFIITAKQYNMIVSKQNH